MSVSKYLLFEGTVITYKVDWNSRLTYTSLFSFLEVSNKGILLKMMASEEHSKAVFGVGAVMHRAVMSL